MKKLILCILMLLCTLFVFSQNDCNCNDAKKVNDFLIKGRENLKKLETYNVFLTKQTVRVNGQRECVSSLRDANCCFIEEIFTNIDDCNKWIKDKTQNGKIVNKYEIGSFNSTAYYKCISCNTNSNTSVDVNINSGEKKAIADKRIAEMEQTTAVILDAVETIKELNYELETKDVQSTYLNILDKQRTDPKSLNPDNDYAQAMLDKYANKEEPCITIGKYNGQDVCKKGDTIIVAAINKKYLLSQQYLIKQGDGVYGHICPSRDFFFVHKSIDNKSTTLFNQNDAIGYITTENKMSNSTLMGEKERFAKSAVGCKFYEKQEFDNPTEEELKQVNMPINENIIGYYGNIPVFYSKDTVFIENKIFLLKQQPRVKQDANYSEGSIQDRIKTTKYYIFANNECIGWVDDFSQTIGFKENNIITFTATKDKGYIEGLNYFGSIYIGPNNPTNADGISNYDLPPQDAIDSAAMEHDKCYGNKDAKGKTSAFFNTDVTDCDENLVTACAFHIPDGSLTDELTNLFESAAKWTYNPDLKTRATLVAAGFKGILLAKYSMKFISDQGKTITTILADNIEPIAETAKAIIGIAGGTTAILGIVTVNIWKENIKAINDYRKYGKITSTSEIFKNALWNEGKVPTEVLTGLLGEKVTGTIMKKGGGYLIKNAQKYNMEPFKAFETFRKVEKKLPYLEAGLETVEIWKKEISK